MPIRIALIIIFSIALNGCSGSIRSISDMISGKGSSQSPNLKLYNQKEKAGITATTMGDQRILIVGGSNNTDIIKETMILDPSDHSIHPATNMITARAEHKSVLMKNGKVMVSGGFTMNSGNWEPIGLTEIYDPSNNTWTSSSPMQVKRTGHTMNVLNDGRVLVTGGYDESWNILSSSEIYLPETDSWTIIGSNLSEARANHQSSVLKNGKVLVLGGVGENRILNSVEIFDPLTNTWTNGSPMEHPRIRMSLSQLLDGRIMVIGGINITPQSEDIVSSTEIYDPVTDSWSPGSSMGIARGGHQSVTLSNGMVVVSGGFISNQGRNISKISEYYNPSTNQWNQLSNTNYELIDFSMASSGSKVYSIGGYNKYSHSSGVEMLDFDQKKWSVISEMKPVVTEVTTNAKGIYFNGQNIDFTFHFSEEVEIEGNPKVPLKIGDFDSYVVPITTGSSLTHTFRYTATPGQVSNYGIILNSIFDFNLGKIRKTDSESEIIDYVPWVNTQKISVNPDAPYVLSVSRPNAGTYRSSYHLDFVVTFSEPVHINNYPHLDISAGGHTHDAYPITTGTSTIHTFRWNIYYYDTQSPIQLLNELDMNSGSIRSSITEKDAIPFIDPPDLSDIIVTRRAAMNVPRSGNEILLSDNRKFLAGGENNSSMDSAEVEVFDPVTNAWTQLASMANSRFWNETILLGDGRVLVFGGVKQVGRPALTATEIYHFDTNTWNPPLQELSEGRFNTTSIVLGDGRILVVGGRGNGASFLDSVEIFNPTTNRWTLLPPLATGRRSYHTLEIVNSNTVRVKGGYDWDGNIIINKPDELYIIP